MNESLERLIQIMPPPAAPRFAQINWEEVESEMGVRLPRDYIEFTGLYGAGAICNFLWVLNPVHGGSLKKKVTWYVNQYREAQEAIEAARSQRVELPYPLYPDPGGLLPCAGIENGDCLNWLTRGAPDEWEVVAWSCDLDASYRCPAMRLTDFLLQVVTQEWPYFEEFFDPEDFQTPSFTPWEE